MIMEISGAGKSPNSSITFRYNANNEELEELFDVCDDDPPTPLFDASPNVRSESASPKRGEKTSILDKCLKSMRTDKTEKSTEKPTEKVLEKVPEKTEDKPLEPKPNNENRGSPKDVSSSPVKEYLNRLSKRSVSESTPELKEGSNETWKIFHDFKFKIAQAVEDMKTRSLEETKEKSVPRENSISDSEENSAVKDLDHSIGDTDNQVSSLESSIQNLSDLTQPLTEKATEREKIISCDNKNSSDSSDDTHKNICKNTFGSDSVRHTKAENAHMMEVESGVEALEDGIDGFSDVPQRESECPNDRHIENVPVQPPQPINNFGLPPSRTNLKKSSKDLTTPRIYFLNFTMYFLTFLLFMNYFLFPNSNIWNGFILGLWFFCFASNLKQWLLDNYFSEWEPHKKSFFQLKRSSIMPVSYTIPSVKEHRPLKKYEGWINHYRYMDYDPYTYQINKTTTAFMKLEGCDLRISYTKSKIGKRALWDEKIEKVAFYQHRLYNLTGARVILLPNGLVKRRLWSKKYPICVILNEQEKIQVLEKESAATERKASEAVYQSKKEQLSQHEVESAETCTSPEKKKKFVWRRKEKSSTHNDVEIGKEGLRHRLVRKMHRDKKSDSVSTIRTDVIETQNQGQTTAQDQTDKNPQFEDTSFQDAEMDLTSKSITSTKDETEEDIDDTELMKIKDFLEESEMEASTDGVVEGEWSVHLIQSKDKHSRLYIFARTGREKYDWYRRLITAISEAELAEAATVEEKPASEPAPEGKDGIEMAVYKLSEKETVAFAKSPKSETIPEGVTIASQSYSLASQLDCYDKTFWPYLLKIIQTKIPSPTCDCRVLPAEVTWVNTMLARVVYDIMRDPLMLARLQTRVQKKLHTLKLPSFMSPLVVTELSLVGPCPLVERVSPPTWDERGVWLDADVRYDGGAYIAILTQINLMKLKEKNVTFEDQLLTTNENMASNVLTATGGTNYSEKRKHAVFDSEMEDSAESSSDDETTALVQPVDSNEHFSQPDVAVSDVPASSKKKFLRIVDKIATNKYFQQVTDYKYVKRAMEGLSNTDIKLQLEVQGLEGRMVFNLPSPPHDRMWFGFRTNPQLVLKARPAVGARSLRFSHISNWIEQKITKEFEKFLVLPNMEDITVDVLTPTPVSFE